MLFFLSRDKDVALVIIKYGGTQYLIKMILAEHALMQNEAILSLTYLATMCLMQFKNALIENNIGHVICRFLEENASTLELPIIYNMFSFIDSIIKSGMIYNFFLLSNITLFFSFTFYKNIS